MNQLALALKYGAKAYPDRRPSPHGYWFRIGDFDIWLHLHASRKEKREVWVVATRGQIFGEEVWLGPVRFYSLRDAFHAVTTNDWQKAEHQQSHVAHPTKNRKILINLRVTESEFYQLQKLAAGKSVSQYIRDLCLSK